MFYFFPPQTLTIKYGPTAVIVEKYSVLVNGVAMDIDKGEIRNGWYIIK